MLRVLLQAQCEYCSNTAEFWTETELSTHCDPCGALIVKPNDSLPNGWTSMHGHGGAPDLQCNLCNAKELF